MPSCLCPRWPQSSVLVAAAALCRLPSVLAGCGPLSSVFCRRSQSSVLVGRGPLSSLAAVLCPLFCLAGCVLNPLSSLAAVHNVASLFSLPAAIPIGRLLSLPTFGLLSVGIAYSPVVPSTPGRPRWLPAVLRKSSPLALATDCRCGLAVLHQ